MGFKIEKKRSGRGAEETAGQPAVTSEMSGAAGPREAPAQEKSTDRRRETVRLSFRLGRGLHTRLKLEAVRRGETIVALVSRWVEETTPAT